MKTKDDYHRAVEQNQALIEHLSAIIYRDKPDKRTPQQRMRAEFLTERVAKLDANIKFRRPEEDEDRYISGIPKNLRQMLEAASVLIAVAAHKNLDIGISMPDGGVLPLKKDDFLKAAKTWHEGGVSIVPALEASMEIIEKVRKVAATDPSAIADCITSDPNVQALKPQAKAPAPKK